MATHGAENYFTVPRQQHYRREGDYSFQRTVCFPGGSTATFGPNDAVPQFYADGAFNRQVEEIDRILTEVNATIERNRTFVPGDSDTDERLSEDDGIDLGRYPSFETSYECQPAFAPSYERQPSFEPSYAIPSPSTHSLSTIVTPTAPPTQLGHNIDTITSQLYQLPPQFSSPSAPDLRLQSSTDPYAHGYPAIDDEETIIFRTDSPPTVTTQPSPVRRASPARRRASPAPRLPIAAVHSRSESGHHLIPPTTMRWQPNTGSVRLGRMVRDRGLGVATVPAARTTTTPSVGDGEGIGGPRGTVEIQLIEEEQFGGREQMTTADIEAGNAVLPLYYRPESRQDTARGPWWR